MAFKVSPDVQEAMDYIDIKTYMIYDKLCQEGYLDRNITDVPVTKFSRAMAHAIGKCRREIRFEESKVRMIDSVKSIISYNLVYIENNVYEAEFWEKIDVTIAHEVCHLTLEHPQVDTLLQFQRISRGHGRKWSEAMDFLGYPNAQRLAEADEFTERMKAFSYVCPTCSVEHAVYKKPPTGRVYVCPTCKEKGIRTLIRKDLVHRVK